MFHGYGFYVYLFWSVRCCQFFDCTELLRCVVVSCSSCCCCSYFRKAIFQPVTAWWTWRLVGAAIVFERNHSTRQAAADAECALLDRCASLLMFSGHLERPECSKHPSQHFLMLKMSDVHFRFQEEPPKHPNKWGFDIIYIYIYLVPFCFCWDFFFYDNPP